MSDDDNYNIRQDDDLSLVAPNSKNYSQNNAKKKQHKKTHITITDADTAMSNNVYMMRVRWVYDADEDDEVRVSGEKFVMRNDSHIR